MINSEPNLANCKTRLSVDLLASIICLEFESTFAVSMVTQTYKICDPDRKSYRICSALHDEMAGADLLSGLCDDLLVSVIYLLPGDGGCSGHASGATATWAANTSCPG
jgi:hypothetical protein